MTSVSARRRIAAAVVVLLLVVGILVAKLVDIQVVHADELDKASANSREIETTLYGTRGKIVDDDGVTLASSVLRWDISVSPSVANKEGAADLQHDADRIGAATGQGGAAVMAIIRDALAQNPDSLYALVDKGVDVGVLNALDALQIPWLYFARHTARTYPDGAVAGNLVGFVSGSGKPQAGIEYTQNACLAGSNGTQTYQRGADGVAIPNSTVTVKKAKDGGDVVLTIDSDLQWFSQQQLAQVVPALGAKFGFVSVVDAKTGKIKVAAQYPSVDPNNVSATAPEYRGALTFSTPYEPGSTFKALTAAALLDQGKATPESHVLAPYRFTSGHGADLHDAGFHPDEKLTLTGVLMESSNTGMSILGARLNDQTRYDYLKKFGIGDETAVNFQGESSGILNPVKDWDDQTKYATMFGQGVSATQAQMMGAYQALANNGVRLPLQLVEGCRHEDGSMTRPPAGKPVRVVSAKTAQTTLKMMESVVNDGELSSKLKIPGYRIAAKTGTAQQPDGKGGYLRYYYVSVMGVATADDPQYVVSVNIGYPTTITSSAAAAPLFKTIMSQVLKTFRVKPSTSAPAAYSPYY